MRLPSCHWSSLPAIGFLTIIGGYFARAVVKQPVVMSNEQLVTELLMPIAAGLILAVMVYRLIQPFH